MKSFAALCLLGLATAVQLQKGAAPPAAPAEPSFESEVADDPRIFEYVDTNKDGKLSGAEKSSALKRAVKDGHITEEEAGAMRKKYGIKAQTQGIDRTTAGYQMGVKNAGGIFERCRNAEDGPACIGGLLSSEQGLPADVAASLVTELRVASRGKDGEEDEGVTMAQMKTSFIDAMYSLYSQMNKDNPAGVAAGTAPFDLSKVTMADVKAASAAPRAGTALAQGSLLSAEAKKKIRGFAAGIFAAADANTNGVVNAKELSAALKKEGAPADTIKAFVSAFKENAGGKVTQEQLTNYLMDGARAARKQGVSEADIEKFVKGIDLTKVTPEDLADAADAAEDAGLY